MIADGPPPAPPPALIVVHPQGEGQADIVVTGRGLDDSARDPTRAVVTIDRTRIDGTAARRLESLLADAAGVQQFRRSDSRSANPTSQGLSLRGIGGNAASRALLVVDGVPQADPFGGWVPFPAYALDRIDRIRVSRGGGDVAAGPGALTGVILIDSRGGDGAPLSGTLAGGSRASIEAGGQATLSRGIGFATLSAAYARGDGFTPIVERQRGPADRAAPYEQLSVAARGVVRIGGATELQVNASGFTDTRERGTAFTSNRNQGADASLRLVGRGTWRWSALAYLQSRDFASSFAGINADRSVATQTLDQVSTPATGLGARVEVAPPVAEGLDLRLGADLRAVSGRTQEVFTYVGGLPTRRREAGGRSRTAGAFADATLATGPLTVNLSARLDRWRIAGGQLTERPIAGGATLTDTRFADRSGTEPTARLGIGWRVAPAVTLRTAAYRAWRLPTLNELYRPFRAGADATAANADLAPERLEGADVGLTVTPMPSLTLSATLFANRLRGAIANVGAGAGPGNFPGVGFVAAGGVYRVRRNLDAITSRGAEVDARWTIGALALRAGWAHADPRVEGSGTTAALDGLRPAQTPRDQWSLGADYAGAGWSIGATLRHVSGQFEDDANVRRLAPATTLDAALRLPVTRALAIEARAENLFDEEVQAAIGATGVIERATPRTLWLGLRFAVD